MKKVKLLIPFLLISGLSGCVSNNFDEYKTPELFFKKIYGDSVLVESSKVDYTQCTDYDLTVSKALRSITDYTEIKTLENKSENYITYGERYPSTAGNIKHLLIVYDDGYIEISCQASFYIRRSFYFSFDSELAASIVETVDQKILEAKQNAIDTENEAFEYCTMENFLQLAKSKKSNPDFFIAERKANYYLSSLEVFDKLEEIDCSRVIEGSNPIPYCVRYIDWGEKQTRWIFELCNDYGSIRLTYVNRDICGNERYGIKIYSIDAKKGQGLYNYIVDNLVGQV